MPGMSWTALLNSNTGAGTANGGAGSSAALNNLCAAPPFVLPANFMYSVGTSFTIRAFGVFSNTGTPTLLVGAYYGGVAGTALAASPAVTTSSGVTNVPWRLELDVTFRTNGTTGTAMTQGVFWHGATVSTWNANVPVPATALATVSLDTTAAKEIAIGGQWGTANASNLITLHGFKIFSDNL